jgi:HSP20 family protein
MMRWDDPFREALSLRQVIDRLFEDAVIQPDRALRGVEGQAMPLIDLAEHDNELVVKAALPGVQPKDVHITIEENVLTIDGELREEPEQQPESAAVPSQPAAAAPAEQPGEQGAQIKKPRYHRRERPIGHFFREVLLPVAVDAGKSGATFEHGLLTITLPKAQAARRRHIAIKSAGQGQQLPANGPSQQAPAASPSAGTKAAT